MKNIKMSKFLLWVLIILCIIANFAWLYLDKQPPEGNGLQDLLPGLDIYNAMRAGSLNYRHFLKICWVYPPLVPASYTLFYLIFGTKTQMELMVNSIYLIIMLLSIYGIGKKMFNEKVGLLSAFIVSSFPGVIAVSRLVYAEFHLMCLTTLSIYLLLKADYFTNRRYSIFLGISLALVALAKWEFPPMLIGPFAVILYHGKSVKTHIPYKSKLKNFFLSLLTGFALSGFWYVPNFKNVIHRLFFWELENVFNNNRTFPFNSLMGIGNLSNYLLGLINSHIGLFYFIVLTACLIFIFLGLLTGRVIKKEEKHSMSLILLWVALPYIAFTVVKIKGYSHMLSVLPPIALVIAAMLEKLKKPHIIFASILIIAYGLNLHLHSFFRIKEIDAINHIKLTYNLNESRFIFSIFADSSDNSWPHKGFNKPDKSDWQIRQILEFIAKDSPYFKEGPTALIIADSIDFNHSKFLYFTLSASKGYILPMAYSENAPKAYLPIDYIIVKSEKRHIGIYEIKRIIDFNSDLWGIKEERLERGLLNFKDYTLIKIYRLPDSSKAAVFKLKGQVKDV